VSPKRFRYLFFESYNKSIISWKRAWWNPAFHKRANLGKLPHDLRLANDPWFVLKRDDAKICLSFIDIQAKITNVVCSGGLANESLFAIILHIHKRLGDAISSVTHATDWSRMTSPTSPHLFKDANELDIQFIEKEIAKFEHVMFIRKISPEFPDDVIRHYIYKYSALEDSGLQIRDPYIGKKMVVYLFSCVIIYFLMKLYLETTC
jgi:hypothetical protein